MLTRFLTLYSRPLRSGVQSSRAWRSRLRKYDLHHFGRYERPRERRCGVRDVANLLSNRTARLREYFKDWARRTECWFKLAVTRVAQTTCEKRAARRDNNKLHDAAEERSTPAGEGLEEMEEHAAQAHRDDHRSRETSEGHNAPESK